MYSCKHKPVYSNSPQNATLLTGFVYIDEVSKLNAMMMADYYSSNHTCHVYVVPLKDQYIKYSLAAPSDSELHNIFDPL